MKMYAACLAMLIAAACCVCLPDSISAQGFPGGGFPGGFPGFPGQGFPGKGASGKSFSRSSGSTSGTGSRSVSFTENGKRVSIVENGSGITVTIDGKKVHAKDAAQLKEQYPEAYRLYKDRIGAASFGGTARGSAGGSAGGSASGSSGGTTRGGAPRMGDASHFESNSSDRSRSVTVMDNGKKVSIHENKAGGITVSVNGKRVRAKNAADLHRRSPEAFRLYEKHLAKPERRHDTPDAKSLLRDKLFEMHKENADNPQIRNLIERMLESVDK